MQNLFALARRSGGFLFVLVVSFSYGLGQLLSRWGYGASQDGYYHFSVAERIFQGDLFPEVGKDLPWTLLADLPVDHYYGYHALIAPFAAVPDRRLGMALASATLFSGVFIALFSFLRARGVAAAWVWALLPGIFSNQDWRYLMLRGGHWLVALSFVYLHLAFFVESPRVRRVGLVLVAYVGMLSYQGALVLLVAHLGGLASLWFLCPGALRPKQLRDPLWALLGFALGLTLNPYMDAIAATWKFAAYHIGYMNSDPENLYRGLSEFGPIPLDLLWQNPDFIVLPLLVLILMGNQVMLRRQGRPVDTAVAVMAGVAMAGMLITGRAIRMREYAVPWMFTFMALCAPRSLLLTSWARAAHVLGGGLVLLALWVKWPQTQHQLGQTLPIGQYEGSRPILEAFAGHPVLNIAEGDYTTLRWEYPDVVCVQGLSRYFLTTNRPIFDDVWALRDSPNPRARMEILARFYDRGVRLLAVQHRNLVFQFAEQHPAALRPVYRSQFVGDVAITGSSMYELNRGAIQSEIDHLPAIIAP